MVTITPISTPHRVVEPDDAADSNLTVTNSVFSSNQADYFGGAIKMVDCNGTIKGSSSMGIPLRSKREEPFISTQTVSCWKTMLSLITSQPTPEVGFMPRMPTLLWSETPMKKTPSKPRWPFQWTMRLGMRVPESICPTLEYTTGVDCI